MKSKIEKIKCFIILEKTICFWFWIIISLPLSAQYFYIPDNDINTLQYFEKGDLELSFSLPVQRQSSLQLGYSPLKHLSLSAAVSGHKKRETENFRLMALTKGFSYTAAIGSYYYFNHHYQLSKHDKAIKKQKGILIKGDLGYSRASVSTTVEDLYFIDLKSEQLFFRSGVYLIFGHFELSYSSRFLNLNFLTGKANGNLSNIQWLQDRIEQDININNPYFLRETTIRIRFRTLRFDFYTDYNFIENKKRSSLKYAYFDKGNLNLGVVIHLDKL